MGNRIKKGEKLIVVPRDERIMIRWFKNIDRECEIVNTSAFDPTFCEWSTNKQCWKSFSKTSSYIIRYSEEMNDLLSSLSDPYYQLGPLLKSMDIRATKKQKG